MASVLYQLFLIRTRTAWCDVPGVTGTMQV